MLGRLIIVLLIIAIFANVAWARDLAIIVNKDCPVDGLAWHELVKIFRMERQFWNNGERIILLMQVRDSWEKTLVLERIYHMSSDELDKFWLAKIFTGEIPTIPSVVGTEVMLKKLVQRLPGAISYIDSQSLGNGIKVLRIEGKLPGEAGYLLKEK